MKYRVRKLSVCRTVAADEGLKKVAALQVLIHDTSISGHRVS